MKTADLNFENNNIEEAKFTSSLAMTVALVSWSMLFATLFLGYAVYRLSASVWPPMGFEKISLLYPALSTAVIALSSWTMWRTQSSYQMNQLSRFKWMLNLTIFLGVMFFVLQLVLWRNLNLEGLYVQSGIFASILHGFTWIHAGHVVLGFLGLLYLLPLAVKKTCEQVFLVRVINIAKFWHFLGIIWFLMFFILFLI